MTNSTKPFARYERLEFLGDRILNLIVAYHLYKNPLEYSPKELTTRLRFTSNDNLNEIVESLPEDFKAKIVQFKREVRPDGQPLNADDIEAFIGDYFLEKGLNDTAIHFEAIFAQYLDRFDPTADYISRLKEYSDKEKQPQPDYCLIPPEGGQKGKDVFHFRVYIGGKLLGSGSGSSHTKAKQLASREALNKLDAEE